jgi:hypothetical protein
LPSLDEFWRAAAIGDTYAASVAESLELYETIVVSRLGRTLLFDEVQIGEGRLGLSGRPATGSAGEDLHSTSPVGALSGANLRSGAAWFGSAVSATALPAFWVSEHLATLPHRGWPLHEESSEFRQDSPWWGTLPGVLEDSSPGETRRERVNRTGVPDPPSREEWEREVAEAKEAGLWGKGNFPVNAAPDPEPEHTCCCCVKKVTAKAGQQQDPTDHGGAVRSPVHITIELEHKGSPGKTCACNLTWKEHSSRAYPGHSGKGWVDLVKVHGKKTFAEVEQEAGVKEGGLTPPGKKGDDKVMFKQIGDWISRYAARANSNAWPCQEHFQFSILDVPSAEAPRELYIEVCVYSCEKDCECKDSVKCAYVRQSVTRSDGGGLQGDLLVGREKAGDGPGGGWPSEAK